jgi:hypothetical protein
MIKLEYSHNNSGGSWWLKDEDWFNLEKAGWTIQWCRDDRFYGGERFLGALATTATKMVSDPKTEIREFEKITNQRVSDTGCSCCGSPHSFSWQDENDNLCFVSGEDYDDD